MQHESLYAGIHDSKATATEAGPGVLCRRASLESGSTCGSTRTSESGSLSPRWLPTPPEDGARVHHGAGAGAGATWQPRTSLLAFSSASRRRFGAAIDAATGQHAGAATSCDDGAIVYCICADIDATAAGRPYVYVVCGVSTETCDLVPDGPTPAAPCLLDSRAETGQATAPAPAYADDIGRRWPAAPLWFVAHLCTHGAAIVAHAHAGYTREGPGVLCMRAKQLDIDTACAMHQTPRLKMRYVAADAVPCHQDFCTPGCAGPDAPPVILRAMMGDYEPRTQAVVVLCVGESRKRRRGAARIPHEPLVCGAEDGA